MTKNLIILSDLWGKEQSSWVDNYTVLLKEKFEVKYYDSCELGDVDKSVYTQEILHEQFVNGGIERAVERLLALERDNVIILAFSVGGTIAWKFGIESERIASLYGVSSTRLRYESIKPKGEINLYFGGNDTSGPQKEWFDKMDVSYNILAGKGHQFYKDKEFAAQLSRQILDETNG